MKEARHLKNPLFWLGLGLVLVWVAVFQQPDHQLHLVFCDVGQGDAAIISYRTSQILIDGGPNNQVLQCLSENLPFWDRQIEMVIATHPDADHISGLVDVIERYRVRYFLINSVGKDSAVFEEFERTVLAENTSIYFPQVGDQIKIESLTISFIWPPSQEKVLGATTLEKEVNETSLVFQLSFGQFDALFPGDISSKIEAQLELKDVEVLKIPHHGSKYSSSQGFLEKSAPELAVISVGKNSFGHPTQEVIERLNDQAIEILRTDQEGGIEIISDGEKWGIKK